MVRIDIDARVDRIQQPENMLFSQLTAMQQEICKAAGCSEQWYSYGIVESPFPVPDEMIHESCSPLVHGKYSHPAGMPELRNAVSGFYARHYNVSVPPERIIIGHGVKGLIFPLFTLLNGSVVVPTPGWLGYLPQLRILNKPYYRLYCHRSANYKIRPVQLAGLLKGLVKTEHLLILNNPGYPTGILYTRKELEEIADICRTYNTVILANEAYSLLTYDQTRFVSMGSVYPEGTFVLNGLSMDRGAGGYRIGTCIMPEGSTEKIIREFVKILATIYTAAATPAQQAAIAAYEPNASMDAFLHDTREIHRIMTVRLASICAGIEGVTTVIPEGGFSFMADLSSITTALQAAGIQYSNDLAPALIRHPYHIATVSGESMMGAYSDFFIRFSVTDYNGKQALADFRKNPPVNEAEEELFFTKFGGRMIEGIEMFRRWIQDLQDGKIRYHKEG
jgi:aspartate aminotransferase